MHLFARFAVAAAFSLVATSAIAGSPFNQPWRDKTRALVIDAYEHNSIDWAQLITEKRVVGFINKASDGAGEPWNCTDAETPLEVCRLKFRRYFVAQELYQTRRMLAKSLGLKWGSYHLGRKGDPVAQADHYLETAKPSDDEVMALDIEGLEEQWMSLKDAERFVARIYAKTGRYPILYVNGSTAKHIADNRADYRILSRLNLWYARFTPEIEGHFPKGNWDHYAMWQFSATPNCNDRRCPQRIPGTPNDIDVNVADMTPDALRAVWPLDGLIPEKPLPVQPVATEAPLLVAAAQGFETAVPNVPVSDAASGVALVPLPNSAPREHNGRPKTVFVAMANIADDGAMRLSPSLRPSLGQGAAVVLAAVTASAPLAAPQPETQDAYLPVLDMIITGTVPPAPPALSNAVKAQGDVAPAATIPAAGTGPH
jgi:GH25 family lysozyme M1 (1,4-beta-N-acetylmuramidase)